MVAGPCAPYGPGGPAEVITHSETGPLSVFSNQSVGNYDGVRLGEDFKSSSIGTAPADAAARHSTPRHAAIDSAPPWVLMRVIPDSNRRATATARSGSLDHTEPESPYSESLGIATA